MDKYRAKVMEKVKHGNVELGKEYFDSDEENKLKQVRDDILTNLTRRYPEGNHMLRAVHPKGSGILRATFTVENNLPDNVRYGVFAEPGKTFEACVRFSNTGSINVGKNNDHVPDIRGMAIKLFNVNGPTPSLSPDASKNEQDFTLITAPVFFLDTTTNVSRLIHRLFGWGRIYTYFTFHPIHSFLGVKSTWDGWKVSNPLYARYWSASPYRLGAGTWQAVKYVVRPADPTTGEPLSAQNEPDWTHALTPFPQKTEDHETRKGPDFLRSNMQRTLNRHDTAFNIYVQFQNDPFAQPVEDATVEWKESDCPLVKVATLRVPKQTFNNLERDALEDLLTFHPWHALDDHRPLGGVNRARLVAYTVSSKARHMQNRVAECPVMSSIHEIKKPGIIPANLNVPVPPLSQQT